MAVRLNGRLGDILVSAVILAVGIAGLLKTLDFPERAAMWATWVMGLLVFCTSLHLALTLWKVRAANRANTTPASKDREP